MIRVIFMLVLPFSVFAEEPKFQVLAPNELMIEVPPQNAKFVTFRIGVKREGHDRDDLELGENDITNSKVFIYDQRLNLRKGDTVNYLLAFRDKDGYQTQSGNFYFNGVYLKKPNRRNRFRRDLSSTSSEKPSASFNDEETEEFDPAAPRFGGGHHHHHRRQWHNNHPEFNPFQPPRNFPGFGEFPNFGRNDCNDHRHDACHGRDTERWTGTTNTPDFHGTEEFHCKMCRRFRGTTDTFSSRDNSEPSTTRRTTTTTEVTPDIDIRFGD